MLWHEGRYGSSKAYQERCGQRGHEFGRVGPYQPIQCFDCGRTQSYELAHTGPFEAPTEFTPQDAGRIQDWERRYGSEEEDWN